MKRLATILAVTSLFAFVFALRLYAVAEPQTAIGHSLFRASYDVAFDKSVVLRGFAANLKKYNGFYIPENADHFLCARLENPASEAEFAAISEFYIDKAYGRTGQFVHHLPAPTKMRVADLILARLDSYSTDRATLALTLLESLRQNKNLGKARFIRSDEGTYPKYEEWKEKTALPTAKARFHDWAKRYPEWVQREQHDPLADLSFEIVSP